MQTKYRLTIDQWHKIVDAGVFTDENLEFRDGEIIKLSPEGYWHAIKNETIRDRLVKLFGNTAYIRQAHPVLLNNWEPSPDIAICKAPYSRYLKQLPITEDIYLLIEISDSTLNYDLSDKANRYAANNIQEYWVADINNSILHIHREPSNGRYEQVFTAGAGDVSTSAFPDLNINLDAMFWAN